MRELQSKLREDMRLKEALLQDSARLTALSEHAARIVLEIEKSAEPWLRRHPRRFMQELLALRYDALKLLHESVKGDFAPPVAAARIVEPVRRLLGKESSRGGEPHDGDMIRLRETVAQEVRGIGEQLTSGGPAAAEAWRKLMEEELLPKHKIPKRRLSRGVAFLLGAGAVFAGGKRLLQRQGERPPPTLDKVDAMLLDAQTAAMLRKGMPSWQARLLQGLDRLSEKRGTFVNGVRVE